MFSRFIYVLECISTSLPNFWPNKIQIAPWKKSYDQPREHIKKQRDYFVNKGLSSQSYGFSSSHVWMCELDYKESWASKNWCFWTVVLDKTLVSPLDCKEIQPVHPKGDQSWILIGRTNAEAETLILWPPDAKNWLIGKDSDVGKDWRQEEKGTWDGWTASPTQRTWVWVNSSSWWWTGKPGVLQSMGSQNVEDDLVTEIKIPLYATFCYPFVSWWTFGYKPYRPSPSLTLSPRHYQMLSHSLSSTPHFSL